MVNSNNTETETETHNYICVNCEENFNLDNLICVNEEYYCRNCFEEYFFTCENCSSITDNDNLFVLDSCSLCEGCYNQLYDNNRNRNYLDLDSCFKQFDKTHIQKSKLTIKDNLKVFGLEIESIVNKKFSRRLKELDYFSVVSDGSLSVNGLEFVSSILKNFKPIKSFCKFSKDYLGIDKTCSIHVHIYLNDYFRTLHNIKKIYLAYYLAQEYFFRLVSKSRLHNHYCKLLTKEELYETLSFENISQFEEYFYETDNLREKEILKKDRYFQKRYYWINLHSLFHRNTIEIRNHNATLNYNKITNYVSLHKRFLKWVLKTSMPKIKDSLKDYNSFKKIFNNKLNVYMDNRITELKKMDSV